MRLAQLARRISVKSSEISSFLASKNIEIENSSNAKISDEHVQVVLEYFAPELLKGEEVAVERSEPLEEINEEVAEDEGLVIIDDSATVPESSVEDEILPEVIKPIKVELPGLKVVGKIDLPEPKTKEQSESSEEVGATNDESNTAEKPRTKYQGDNKRTRRPVKDIDRRSRKNPIALKREREEQEALRKKLEQKEKEKELRTQRYLKKVSTKVSPPKPLKRANHEDEYEDFVEEEAKPKTFLGRIINWFVSN